MNVRAIPVGFLGSLTVWDAGQARPNTSNLNAYDAQPKSIMAIVKAGTNGNVSFFPSDAMDLVVDVVGFFAPAGAEGATVFHEMGACKVVNTQDPNGPAGGPLLLGQTPRDFPIGIPVGACGGAAWARAYVMNLTLAPLAQLASVIIQPSGPGYVPGWTLLSTDAQVTAGTGLVPASLSGLRVLSSDATHLTIDIAGYFD
jgi:hypothetical protein